MDYTTYLPQLLLVAGAALQWARADRRFADSTYALTAVVLALTAHLLVANYAADFRSLILSTLVSLPQSIGVVLAGTGAVSVLSNIAVTAGLDPTHPAVPVTNSK